MSRDQNLVASLQALFPDRLARNCLDSNDAAHLVVYEGTDGRACFEALEQTNSVVGFLLKNPDRKQIYLLAVDHCFFEDHEEPRCDCVLFDNQHFCFVELKLNVVKRRRVTQTLKEARKQLGATIRFFKTAIQPKSEDFFDFTLEAYVVMQTAVYPRKRASRDVVFIKFLEEFGVVLYEQNSKSF